MTGQADVGYGSAFWRLWWHDVRDRISGNAARANARWGFLTPPSGSGKLIWVKVNAHPENIILAVEVLRAIREHRLDVRLALTFEDDYPALLREPLQGLKKIGLGYGPSDTPAAVRRVLRAFAPLGVVTVGTQPLTHLFSALAASNTRTVVINSQAPSAPTPVEAVYPLNQAQHQDWERSGCARYLSRSANFFTQMTQAQVDPNFKSYIGGARTLDLWWVHRLGCHAMVDVASLWMNSPLAAQGVLFVSGDECATVKEIFRNGGSALLMISQWQRNALIPGTVVVVDDQRWLPAIAASCTAAHFSMANDREFWQALAGGSPVSVSTERLAQAYLNDTHQLSFAVCAEAAQLFPLWQHYLTDPISARKYGDSLRRVFWTERRRADEISRELLQRIYDW